MAYNQTSMKYYRIRFPSVLPSKAQNERERDFGECREILLSVGEVIW